MASTTHNPIPMAARRVQNPLAIVLSLGLLVFLALPWSLEHKAHIALHGLCAQRPSHTYMFGDRALPFDARMTGIYLGYLVTSLLLFAAGAHRWCKPPTVSRIIILLGLGGIMVLDGFNSLLKDLKLPYPYEPHNWLRIVTGMSAGMVLAVALCFLISSSLWNQVDNRKQTLERLVLLPLAALMLVPVGLLIGSGWAFLYVPMVLLLIASALTALSSLALVVLVILTRRDFSFSGPRDLNRTAAFAVMTGVALMMALSIGRMVLDSFSGPTSLT